MVCVNTGGLRGFDNVLWKVQKYRGGRKPSIQFTYHSVDGEEGEPSRFNVDSEYGWEA